MFSLRLKHFLIFSVALFFIILPNLYALIVGGSGAKRPLSQKNLYDSIKTEDQYWALLKEANEETFKNEFEPEILLLLDKKLRGDYSKLSSLTDRKSFIEYYWKAQNPDPLLPENDRLLNHINRRTYARKHFPLAQPPYYDDRGKYYIKYGKPHFRYQDPGGSRAIKSLVSIPFNYYSTKPNESWSYVNVARDYVVHFAKEEDCSFMEIKTLKSVILGSQRRGRLVWYWSDVLKNRFWMSPLINDAVTEFINIENTLLQRPGGGGGRVVRDSDADARTIQTDLYSNLRELENESRKASLDAPRSIYRPVYARNKLPFTDSIAQFRGPEGKTRVEIFMLSPLKKYVDLSGQVSIDTVDVDFSSMLRDDRFNTVATNHLQRHFLVEVADLKRSFQAVGNLTLTAPPNQLELHLQVRNNRNHRIGFSQRPINIRSFSGQNLMVSDIQFFLHLTDAKERLLLPVIEKQNVMLAPYPVSKVRKSLALYCYFEIYNLQAIGFGREYELTYKVYMTDAKEPSISIIQTQPVDENISQELIEIDLSKLTNRAYKLEIIVSDTNDKAIVARSQKKFMLTD